jgi:hypothetical protein
MSNEPIITVCKHIHSKEQEAEFLFGHRGFTLAAFCAECEVKFREADEKFADMPEAEIDFSKMDICQGIADPKAISVPEAIELGIPEKVGSTDEEASVYGRPNA